MIDLRLDAQTPVLIHGLARPHGRRHLEHMRAYGTNIVAGVAYRADVEAPDDLPMFRSCAEAVAATQAEACISFGRPETVIDAVLDAAESRIRLIVSAAKGVPVHDSLRALRRMRDLGTVWLGSASAGLALPSAALKLGSIPNNALIPGPFALLTTCDALAFEVSRQMAADALGHSVWIGLGNDPVKGTRLAEVLPFLQQDAETQAVVLVSAVGGTDEEEMAQAVVDEKFDKPIFALIAGQNLPNSFATTHVEALHGGLSATAGRKRAALEAAGATVYNSIGSLLEALRDAAAKK